MTGEEEMPPAADPPGATPEADHSPSVTISFEELSDEMLRAAGNRLLRVSIGDDTAELLGWGVVPISGGRGFIVQMAIPTETGRQIVNRTTILPGPETVMVAWMEYNPEWFPRVEPQEVSLPLTNRAQDRAARRPSRRVH